MAVDLAQKTGHAQEGLLSTASHISLNINKSYSANLHRVTAEQVVLILITYAFNLLNRDMYLQLVQQIYLHPAEKYYRASFLHSTSQFSCILFKRLTYTPLKSITYALLNRVYCTPPSRFTSALLNTVICSKLNRVT